MARKKKKILNKELSEKADSLKGTLRPQVHLDALSLHAKKFEDRSKKQKAGYVKHKKNLRGE